MAALLKLSPTSIFLRRGLHMASPLWGKVIVTFPKGAESINEGDVAKILKKVGDGIAQDELVVEVETEKTPTKVNAPNSGVVTQIFVNEGDTIQVGAQLFEFEEGAAPAAPAPKPEAPKAAPKVEASKPASSPSSPPAAPKPAPKVEAAPSNTPSAAPAVQIVDEVTRVPMTRIRKTIASRLKDAQNTAAILTTFNEIDMSNAKEFVGKHKENILKQHGVKLGFMSTFLKASAYALQQQPVMNAYIDGNDIVYNKGVHISVAVSSPKGLVVPVVRNVQNMSYIDIEKAIADLSTKARNNSLTPEDLSGGTFTVSNGGVFGSLMGTPILNSPQSAILGMHAINDRPIALNGQVVIRPMMYVALTYDHRLIDGREAVTFLKGIKSFIEDPRISLL